jgi:prepilin-type N-terminal cleavage/methylation domain-containing protein
MTLHYLDKNKGFTLIELLVVISIIGLLSTLAAVSLKNARAKARDAQRIADIKQLQTALDLYYDTNKSYIISGNCGSTSPNSGWCNSIQSLSGGSWVRNGATNLSSFIKSDPLDPKPVASPNWAPSGGGTYFYYANSYGGSGQWYMIIYGLENTGNTIQQTDGVRACDGTYFHYGNGSNGIMTVGRSCGQ